MSTTKSSKALLIATLLILAIGQSAYAECIFERKSKIAEELRLPIHRWSNGQNRQPEGIIVAIPGLVFSGLAYESLAQHYCDKNFLVYTIDLRGFGEWRAPSSSEDDKQIHFTQSKDDLTRLLEALRHEYPGVPIYGLGESIGANYALWEVSTKPELLDGVVLVSVSYKVSVHPRALWVKTFFEGLYHSKHPINIAPYLKPYLSENKEIIERCMSHPDTCTQMSVEDLIKAAVTNRRTVQQLDKIPESMPILVVAGKKDLIQKTCKLPEMVSRMSSKKAELVVLPDKGHMLIEHQPVNPEVYDVVDDWLQKCIESRQPAAVSHLP